MICLHQSSECVNKREWDEEKGEFENSKTFCELIVVVARAEGEHNKWGEVPRDCVANQNATLSHAWKLALTAQCRLGTKLKLNLRANFSMKTISSPSPKFQPPAGN